MLITESGPRVLRDVADITTRDWNRGAADYASIESDASRYARVAAVMVKLAAIRSGMRIVDLACGTGTVTGHLVGRFDDLSITAIDQSSAMLQIARQRFSSPSIRFELARAERLDEVAPGAVDRVLCNAAFWQMNMRRVLRAVRGRLVADGYFVVSCPDQSPSGDATNVNELYARSKLAWMLLEAREAIGRPLVRDHRRERVSQADIVLGHATDCGFRLAASRTVPVQSSVEGTLQFLQLPALVKASPLLAGLSPSEREEVLRVVTTELQYVDATVSPKLWRVLVLAPV